jgi:hypothetical protein
MDKPLPTAASAPPIRFRNDVLRLVYAAMLKRFPIDTVRSFWKDRRIPEIGIIDELSLYKHIWQESKSTPIGFMFGTLKIGRAHV